jgi:hypothetical protein
MVEQTGNRLITNSRSKNNVSSLMNGDILLENTGERYNISISLSALKGMDAYKLNQLMGLIFSPIILTQNKISDLNNNIIVNIKERTTRKPYQHIAFFIENFHHYTGGRYSIYHQAAMLSNFLKVTVVTNSKPPFYNDFKDYYTENFEIIESANFLYDDKESRFDAVIGLPITGGIYSHMYSKKFNLPLYLIMFESPNWISKYKTSADSDEEYWKSYKRCLMDADRIIVPSFESQKYLYEWLGKEKNNIYVQYPCINQVVADKIKYESSNDTMDTKRKHILFISRVISSKSPISLIKETNPEHYHFHIIGKIKNEDVDYIENMKKLGYEIDVHGRIDDESKFRLVKKCDMLIVPTKFEGFGMPPMEALYFNKPVISYRLPVLEEIYSNNIIYSNPNASDMANEINKYFFGVNKGNIVKTGIVGDEIENKKKELGFISIKNCVNGLLDILEIPKISVGMIVYNGSDYIEYAIKSIYNYVNQIIIVDGSVEKYSDSDSISSNDGTIEIIKRLKEKDIFNKIEFVPALDRKWKDKIEMQNEIAKRVTGEYYVKIDHDEIWKPETLLAAINFMEKNLKVNILKMPFYHFWLNFNQVAIDDGGKWSTKHPRVWRWSNGMKHLLSFNYFVDSKNNRITGDAEFKGDRIYHFGYVRQLNILKNKINYYKTRGIEKNVSDTVTNWKKGNETQPTQKGANSSCIDFDKKLLPEILKDHPYYNIKDIRGVK